MAAATPALTADTQWRAALLLLFALTLFALRDTSPYPKYGPKVTERVFMDISIDGQYEGRVVFGVFGDTVPRTAENFVELAKRAPGSGYKGSKIHRIVPGFVVQGGDFTHNDGTGGHSIWDTKTFADENFKVGFQTGYVAMANAGPDSNASQWFVTFKPTPWLDGKHVVFAKILAGWEVLTKLQSLDLGKKGKTDLPYLDVVVSDCGVLGDNEQ